MTWPEVEIWRWVCVVVQVQSSASRVKRRRPMRSRRTFAVWRRPTSRTAVSSTSTTGQSVAASWPDPEPLHWPLTPLHPTRHSRWTCSKASTLPKGRLNYTFNDLHLLSTSSNFVAVFTYTNELGTVGTVYRAKFIFFSEVCNFLVTDKFQHRKLQSSDEK